MFGIEKGFWVGMAVVTLVVIIYVTIAWKMTPKK